jgi:hypothetical protein
MSKVLGQFVIVTAVFAIVIGGTYPMVIEASTKEQVNHYPDKLGLEDLLARRQFLLAEAHPEKIDAYLAAGDRLASVLLREQQLQAAADIYQKQLAATWGLAPKAYNPRYITATLKLAGVHRDMNLPKAALTCYQSVLDLDRQYLAKDDAKIARDLNNIGLTHYLAGLGLEADKDRQPEFQLAINNYKQALDINAKRPEGKTARAATLWNLYLAQRDIGHKSEALACRQEARAIDQSMQRVCREP